MRMCREDKQLKKEDGDDYQLLSLSTLYTSTYTTGVSALGVKGHARQLGGNFCFIYNSCRQQFTLCMVQSCLNFIALQPIAWNRPYSLFHKVHQPIKSHSDY